MYRSRYLTFSQFAALIFILSSLLSFKFGKYFSYHSTLLLLIWGLPLTAVAAVFLLLFPRVRSVFIIPVLIFSISYMYASYRAAPFPYPYGDFVKVNTKLISDLRIRGGNVQFTARAVGILREHVAEDLPKMMNLGFPGRKVLLNIPAGKTLPQRGDTIQVRGVFTGLPFEKSESYARYLTSRGIDAVFEGSSEGLNIVKQSKKYSIINISNRLKKYVKKVNERLLPWPQSEFAFAIFTGNRDDLPPFVTDAFRESGTMHLLAVSGLHIGFLVMFLFLIMRVFRINRTASYLLLVCIVVFYMIFIGDAPSVKRASIMVLLGIVIFLLDRDRNYLNVLSIAFSILWVANPRIITNPGFLLSFAATFSILFLTPRFMKLFESIMPAFLAGPLAVSTAVQVYIFPILLAYFGTFPYITIAANLPVVPLAGISLGLEMIYLAVYPVFLPLAVTVAETNLFVITTILRLNMFFSRVPPLLARGFPQYFIPVYFVFVTAAVFILVEKHRITAGMDAAGMDAAGMDAAGKPGN